VAGLAAGVGRRYRCNRGGGAGLPAARREKGSKGGGVWLGWEDELTRRLDGAGPPPPGAAPPSARRSSSGSSLVKLRPCARASLSSLRPGSVRSE
jgi:hypothetical protein